MDIEVIQTNFWVNPTKFQFSFISYSLAIKLLEEEGVNFQMDIVVIQTNFWLNPTKGAHFDGDESNIIIHLSD